MNEVGAAFFLLFREKKEMGREGGGEREGERENSVAVVPVIKIIEAAQGYSPDRDNDSYNDVECYA